MKVGIVICTDQNQTCFVAIRHATFQLMEQKDVHLYFVDAGLHCGKGQDSRHEVHELLKSYTQSGGKVHRSRTRDTLKNRLARDFGRMVPPKQLESLCYNDKFQSIMTRGASLKKFAS